MAASPQLLDLNTGLPTQISQYARQPAYEATITQTGARTDVATQQVDQRTSQQQVSQMDILNTTPAALQALEELIRQLSDRPGISNAELEAKAPDATPMYTRTGWVYSDPLTGRTVYPQDVVQFNRQRAAERERLKQESGIIRGGTESQKVIEQQRQQEISRTREQQGKYSKEAAISDAQFLIDKVIADTLEKVMPQIVAASEGAGTSKGTFRGLALERAAQGAAVEGGALGAQLSVQYGQIYNQLEAMLVEMTKQDPNSPAALLLQALQSSKGIVQRGTTIQNVTGQTTGATQTQTKIGPSVQIADVNRVQNIGEQGSGMTGIPNVIAAPLSFQPQRADPYLAQIQTGQAEPRGGDYTFIETTPIETVFDTNQTYADLIGEEE